MDILNELENFYTSYPYEKGIIGHSRKGKPIYYFGAVKSAFPKILITGGIHAREYITTLLCLEMLKGFCRSERIASVYFVPAVNPDGIKIAENQIIDYKANAFGVDLNVNFDAKWGSGKKNAFKRGAENYVGTFPFSEPETRALKNFTLLLRPDITLSYHSKGEEIYWNFFQDGEREERDFYLGRQIQKATGYKLVTLKGSSGGYKDWCIEKLKIPSFTIEVGGDNLFHPIGKEKLSEIYRKNKKVISFLIKGYKNATKIYGNGAKRSEKGV